MGDAAKHCQIGLAIGRLCSDQVCRFVSCTTIDEVETENFFHLINILSCVVKHFFFYKHKQSDDFVLFLASFGSLTQLVQSVALTGRKSLVRIQYDPQLR